MPHKNYAFDGRWHFDLRDENFVFTPSRHDNHILQRGSYDIDGLPYKKNRTEIGWQERSDRVDFYCRMSSRLPEAYEAIKFMFGEP